MRKITHTDLEEEVRKACIKASLEGSPDLRPALEDALFRESSELGKDAIQKLIDNLDIASKERIPICQDTGFAMFFVERGEEVMVDGPGLSAAINKGMTDAYRDAYLRKATCHCLTRKNRGDNSPAIIYEETVPGDGLSVHFMAKGGGSENMSAIGMLKPSQGRDGVVEFVAGVMDRAGANPCPPVILGVGLGGTMEKAALNSKKALLRPLMYANPDPELAAMETDILREVNRLGIGPQGYGGEVTALAVSMLRHPCHIASLPVAVTVQCHASRHAKFEL